MALQRLLAWLCQCHHTNTTFPQGRHAHAHVTCLDCGTEFSYNVRTWTRGTAQPTKTANVLRAVLHGGAKEAN